MRRPSTFFWVCAIYAVLVVGIFAFWFDGEKDSLHYIVTRDLGKGTRLTSDMLMLPEAYGDFHDKIRLDGEFGQMVGAYLKTDLRCGNTITPKIALPWPDLRGTNIVTVAVPEGADWQLYNAGARVSVGDGDRRQQALVVAVIPIKQAAGALSDTGSVKDRWLLLLNAAAIGGAPLVKTDKTSILAIESPPIYSGGG